MSVRPVELIGFDAHDEIDEIFAVFGIDFHYKSILPEHLTDVLRAQHPGIELRSLELLTAATCKIGGMPSPDNQDHVIVDSIEVPLDLWIRFISTDGGLHGLTIRLVIHAADIQTSLRFTSDLFVRDQIERS